MENICLKYGVKRGDKTAKWSFIFFCISVASVLLSFLIISISSDEGEIVTGKMFAWIIFVFFVLPVTVVISFVGCVLGCISLCRTALRNGKIWLVLNLLVFIASSSVIVWSYRDYINWKLSDEHKMEKAIKKGNVEAVKKYVKKGADVNFINRHEETALMCAISIHNFEIIKILLNNKADVNKTGYHKITPLHHLCDSSNDQVSGNDKWDDFEVAKLLLEHGANPNAVCDWPNKTPLLIAAEQGNEEIVDLLLAHGADINQRGIWTPGQSGNTALHYAAWKGNMKLAVFLLNKGADVNIKGVNKETPLHKAEGPNKEEMVKLLLSWGADPNDKDRFGRPSLEIK